MPENIQERAAELIEALEFRNTVALIDWLDDPDWRDIEALEQPQRDDTARAIGYLQGAADASTFPQPI